MPLFFPTLFASYFINLVLLLPTQHNFQKHYEKRFLHLFNPFVVTVLYSLYIISPLAEQDAKGRLSTKEEEQQIKT